MNTPREKFVAAMKGTNEGAIMDALTEIATESGYPYDSHGHNAFKLSYMANYIVCDNRYKGTDS